MGGIRRIASGGTGGLLLLSCLGGCSLVSVPSQAHPDCSWSTSPPGNQKSLCAQTFRTLRALAQAAASGNDSTVRRLVPNASVARRIIAYGRDQRRQGLQWMHIDPSIAMGTVSGGRVGAGFYIIGRSGAGKISAPETLYLRVRDGRAIVVGDQPAQEW